MAKYTWLLHRCSSFLVVKTLSLAMIVKNEQGTIARVLSCAKSFCDELVVVDTGSTDSTLEIVKSMGAKVFHFEWIDNFAAARNHAFEQCSKDWIVWLDADDVVPEESCQNVRALKEAILDEQHDAIFVPYHCAFDSIGQPTFSMYRERFLRRGAQLKWDYAVHECITVPEGRALYRNEIVIEHRPLEAKLKTKVGRNLRILEASIAAGDRSERNLFYYANELRDNNRFAEAVSMYDEYLEIATRQEEKYDAARSSFQCRVELKQEDMALPWALKAIAINPQRAEAFNDIGLYFYQRERWRDAIPFFTAATAVSNPPNSGFINSAHYGWLPYDYLSICYDKIGDFPKAVEMTLKAMPGNPDQQRLLKNLDGQYRQIQNRRFL